MTDKKTIVEIERKLAQGISKKQIFVDLGGADDLATAIASAPYYGDRKRYGTLNALLVAILLYAAIIKITSTILAVHEHHLPIYVAFFGSFYPSVFAYLAFQIAHFRGWAYLPAALFCLVLFLHNLEPTFSQFKGSAFVINLLLIAPLLPGLVIGLHLRRRLCPHLGFVGARTDKTGRYNFMDG